MSEPIYFDIVLPPSEYEDDEFRKREVLVLIQRDGITQTREKLDVTMNCVVVPGLEADVGDTVVLSGVDWGQVKRREIDELTGRPKIGDKEDSKTFGPASYILAPEVWCAAGRLGIRTSKEPPDGLANFQDDEAMRRLEG